MNSVDFIGGWNSFLSFFPSGIWNILTVAGVLIALTGLAIWVWKKRKAGAGGGGGGGFPWLYLIIGGTLAGPKIVVPAILLLAQVLLVLFVKVLEWGGQQLS